MSNDKISQFWDKYRDISIRNNIKPETVKWYIQHVKDYIAAHPNRKLNTHTAQDLKKYLTAKGRNTSLEDGQFKQLITALKILFTDLVKPSWVENFSWNDISMAATALTPNHSTVARDYQRTSKQISEDHIRHSKSISGNAPNVWTLFASTWTDYAHRLIAEIRIRQYSIRTEQTYCEWFARFAAFCDLHDPKKLADSDIRRYLEHLVINRNVSGSTQSVALKTHHLPYFASFLCNTPAGISL